MAVASTRNADATRLAVLDAAEALFAEHGFAGTAMRELARSAGVSQPLLYHHFGSKEQLYASVKQRVMQRYVDQYADGDSLTDRPVDLPLEMERLHAFLQENQTLLRLSAWARLEKDDAPWPGEPELMHALRQRIEIAQRMGFIRHDVHARNLAIMLVAITYYWVDHQNYYAATFSTPESEAAYLSQAIEVLTRGASTQS